MAVKLVASTTGCGPLQGKNAEEVISYAARVSNPSNQSNFDTAPKLLKYCIRNKHWSIFETATATFEVTTSRAIADQILRHTSFRFQQASLRYSPADSYVEATARRQDTSNRQNSIDDLPHDIQQWFLDAQRDLWEASWQTYQRCLELGIAKECARFVLPLSTRTTLYVTGNFRDIFHYVNLRASQETQLEHRIVAEQMRQLVCDNFPVLAEAFAWIV